MKYLKQRFGKCPYNKSSLDPTSRSVSIPFHRIKQNIQGVGLSIVQTIVIYTNKPH